MNIDLEIARGILGLAAGERRQGNRVASRLAYGRVHQMSKLAPQLLIDLVLSCLDVGEVVPAVAYAEEAVQRCPGPRSRALRALAVHAAGPSDRAVSLLAACWRERDMLTPRDRRRIQLALAELRLWYVGDAEGAAACFQDAEPTRVTDDGELLHLRALQHAGGVPTASLAARFVRFATDRLDQGMRISTQAVNKTTATDSGPRAKARIGLLSNQFCESAVGFMGLGAVRELSRHAELVFFNRGDRQDWLTDEFRHLAKFWVECADLASSKLASCLARYELDAVIDLSGWTDLDAMRALSRQPVRSQWKWLGGQSMTMGLSCYEGLIADHTTVPGASTAFYAEPVVRLTVPAFTYICPPGFKVNRSAATRTRSPRGGRHAHVVVAGHPARIGRSVIKQIKLLQPDRVTLVDRAWLSTMARAHAARRLTGLTAELDFQTPMTASERLATFQELDATFLDTAPYSMGLSAVELRYLGKRVLFPSTPEMGCHYEMRGQAYLAATRLDHHKQLGQELLALCLSRDSQAPAGRLNP